MLFKTHILNAIELGEVTTAFRVWRRPTVKPQGRLRTAVGELVIEDLREVSRDDISEADARAAGARDRAALLAELGDRPGRLYRIDFRLDRPDGRRALAADDDLDTEALAAIASALDRLDRRSRNGAWTRGVLDLIGGHPGRPAGELADATGMDKPAFKRRVRSLKELGLTESLEIGYRLSPRGRRYLREVAGCDGRQPEKTIDGDDVAIAPFGPGDRQAVIDLAIAAWTPVFAKTRHDVPGFVYDTFYPDGWEARQRADVATLLDTEPENIWLARRGADPVGFVGIRIHADDRMGEICILAVSPEHQRKGIGRRLMRFSEQHIRAAGMRMIMVETIGDSGHAPARRAYENFGFQKWPVARYFKKL